MSRIWDRSVPVLLVAFLYCILVLRLHDHEDDDELHPTMRDTKNNMIDTHNKNRLFPNKNTLSLNKAKGDMKSLKYILIYTPDINPFHLLQKQQNSFIDNKCRYTNCYVTTDRKHLKDLGDFDALLFSGVFVREMRIPDLPQIRSPKQKYVFATLESAPLHPVTNPMFDDFFNWTWTYRFDSDISWKYITIYNLKGDVIGPVKDMIWPNSLEPASEQVKKKLRYKVKAVAWFVSHCKTQSRREKFVKDFKKESNKYGWSVDVYGSCGNRICGHRCSKSPNCLDMLQKDYYFYFSFENSLEQDYVTEKLMIALNNYVVPVVLGGANYSWFLHPSSYLDARMLGTRNLARVINDAINNSTLYYEFFRWRNHFKYESTEETTGLCNLCNSLNDEEMMKTNAHIEFRLWWNGKMRQKTYDFVLKNFIENEELLDLAATYNFSRANSLVLLNNIRNSSVNPHVHLHNLVLNSSVRIKEGIESPKKFTKTYAITNVTIAHNDSTENFDPVLLQNYSYSATSNETLFTTTPTNANDYTDYTATL